jgi:hypothetical protein
MEIPPDERAGLFTRRVARTAWGLVIVGAAAELLLRKSIPGALSLTGAGAVAIINFRWLDAVIQRVVQPVKPQYGFRAVLRFIGRLALLSGVFAALIWVPAVDGIAVALGFSALVVALIFEGLRWGRVGGG